MAESYGSATAAETSWTRRDGQLADGGQLVVTIGSAVW
jgi:hypothetical protein